MEPVLDWDSTHDCTESTATLVSDLFGILSFTLKSAVFIEYKDLYTELWFRKFYGSMGVVHPLHIEGESFVGDFFLVDYDDKNYRVTPTIKIDI